MFAEGAPSPVPSFTDLRRRIHAGETLFGTFLGLASPIAAEICARAGFDWVIVDLEHGSGSESDLLASLLAIGTTSTAANDVCRRALESKGLIRTRRCTPLSDSRVP